MKAVVQRFSEGRDCMTAGEIRSMLREDRSRGEQALFEEYYSYGFLSDMEAWEITGTESCYGRECAVIEGVSNFYN